MVGDRDQLLPRLLTMVITIAQAAGTNAIHGYHSSQAIRHDPQPWLSLTPNDPSPLPSMVISRAFWLGMSNNPGYDACRPHRHG